MIDPLGACVRYLASNSGVTALCGARIAPRHKFTNTTVSTGWKTPAKAIELQYDPGGTPDIDSSVQQVRFKGVCYGETDQEAGKVYAALVNVTRNPNRVVVTTENGNALIYWFLLDGTPETAFDDTVSMPYVQVYLSARVAEIAV